MIMLPLLLYSQWRSEDMTTYTRLNKQYDTALTAATQDATTILRRTSVGQNEAGYASSKENPTDKDAALKTFLQSLAVNFQTENTNTIDLISRYVPAFAVLENDGLSLSVFQHSSDTNGNDILKRRWLPKVPFSYTDNSGNIINFTIDQDVEIYVKALDEWYEGNREEVMDLLKEEVDYKEPDNNKPTLLDKVPKELLAKLKENLSDDLYERLIANIKEISSVDELDEDIQDEVSEIDYDLLSDLIVALTPEDIEDPENEATIEPSDEVVESDADTLRARLSMQTTAELRDALSEELFDELVQMLGKYKSEFDIEPGIVDKVQEKVSDELFIRFLTDISTPTEAQRAGDICAKPADTDDTEKAITKTANPISNTISNPIYKALDNLTDDTTKSTDTTGADESNGMDVEIGGTTGEPTDTSDEDTTDEDTTDEDTSDEDTSDEDDTSNNGDSADDNDSSENEEPEDVSPAPIEDDEDPYASDVEKDNEIPTDCSYNSNGDDQSKPDDNSGEDGEEPVVEEMPAIFILNNKDTFERIRKQVIVSVIQDQFAYYINQHNTYTRELGITYKFSLPLISKEDWYNTVDDVGILAFVQGLQFSRGDYMYNGHAFVGTRLLKKQRIYGAEVDHKKVYYNSSCKFDYEATEIFNSRKEAAKNGYSEISCLNKK